MISIDWITVWKEVEEAHKGLGNLLSYARQKEIIENAVEKQLKGEK